MKNVNASIPWILMVLPCTFVLWMSSAERASAGIVPADSIRAEVVAALNTAADQNGLDIEVSVPYTHHVRIRDVENPVMNLTVPSGELYRRRVPVKVEFIGAEGEVVRRVTVFARVKSFAAVAVTAVDVERGTPLSLKNVVMKKMEVTCIRDYFVSTDGIEGIQAKRKLKAGDVLTKTSIKPIPLISRGDRVIVKACIGNIMVKSEGIAREDGSLNDTIRVYNEVIRKTIYGIVIDKRIVMIGGEGG